MGWIALCPFFHCLISSEEGRLIHRTWSGGLRKKGKSRDIQKGKSRGHWDWLHRGWRIRRQKWQQALQSRERPESVNYRSRVRGSKRLSVLLGKVMGSVLHMLSQRQKWDTQYPLKDIGFISSMNPREMHREGISRVTLINTVKCQGCKMRSELVELRSVVKRWSQENPRCLSSKG